MNITKEITKFIIDVDKAIIFVRLICIFENSLNEFVDIVNIPIIGTISKDKSNIKKLK
jgi:hypothetical protein